MDVTSSGGSPQKLAIQRLSSPTSELDSFQRRALANSPSITVPADAKEAVWAALAAQLAAGPPPASTAPPASGIRLSASGVASKAWLALPAFVGLGALAYFALRGPHGQPQHAPAPPAVTQPALLAPPLNLSSPIAAGSADPGVAAPSALPEPSAHHGAASAPASAADLEREIALLAQARAQLRAGNAAGAQATLAQMQSQFPHRALRQERQVLGIMAQNALGNREAARHSALTFIKAHPESPHDAQLQRMIDQP